MDDYDFDFVFRDFVFRDFVFRDFVFRDFVFPFCDLSDDQFEAIYYEPRVSVAPDGTRQQFRGQWYPLENDDAYTRRIWG
jgi:hypothetical protein